MGEVETEHHRGCTVPTLGEHHLLIVNSGGIIGCAVELAMKADTEYKKKVEAEGVRLYIENLINNTISKNVAQILCQVAAKKETDIFFREEALLLAKNRLENLGDIWL